MTCEENSKQIQFGVSISRYESNQSCRIDLENTSRRITFLYLKREVDLTDACRFNYTYKSWVKGCMQTQIFGKSTKYMCIHT